MTKRIFTILIGLFFSVIAVAVMIFVVIMSPFLDSIDEMHDYKQFIDNQTENQYERN